MAAIRRLLKNPIRATIVLASAVLGLLFCVQVLSLALFGFTSQCGKLYIMLVPIMTIGACLCLPIEKYDQDSAITYLCYIIFLGVSGMVTSYCLDNPTVFPRTLYVLICGVLVLRWSGLKQRAVVYGLLAAFTIGLAAWACSNAMGATGAAFSILSTFLPRDKV